MGLVANDLLPVHSLAEITFDFPENKKDVSVMGMIVRKEASSDKTMIGIEFTTPFSSGRTEISKYLKEVYS